VQTRGKNPGYANGHERDYN